MPNDWNAYMKEDLRVEPIGCGGLQGMTFTVKDVFAVKGHVNSGGNPDWLATHEPAVRHAEAVDRLLQAGASLEGAAHTDELMFSLNGENHHYGTPVNPRAPGCIPGGSSSGSAAAVAAGLVDFALGTDTGGSVRIPSAYCGLFGIRPTHGVISVDGVIPLAASFDTVGWMARDANVLLQVGNVLLDCDGVAKLANHAIHAIHAKGGYRRLLMATDAWQSAEHPVRELLAEPRQMLEAEMSCDRIVLEPEGLSNWVDTFRTLQGYEIWSAHGEWIRNHRPRFGPGIAERFAWTASLRKEEYDRMTAVRQAIRESLIQLLGLDGLLVIPTAPCTAPRIGLTSEVTESIRARVMQLSCIAGLSGLPQVTVPFSRGDELPVGLSFIAGPHQDLKLLRWVCEAVDRFGRSSPDDNELNRQGLEKSS